MCPYPPPPAALHGLLRVDAHMPIGLGCNLVGHVGCLWRRTVNALGGASDPERPSVAR